MSKQIKLILKRGLKSILSTKLFSALMFLIILVSGITYTTLESSANSFRKSYIQTVENGNLHDYVLKTNFKLGDQSTNSSFEFEAKDSNGAIVDVYDRSGTEPILDPEKIYNLSHKKLVDEREVFLQINKNSINGYFNNNYINSLNNISILFKVNRSEVDKNIFSNLLNKPDVEIAILKATDAKISSLKSNVENNFSTIFSQGILNEKLANGQNYSNYLVSKPIRSITVNFGIESRKVVQYVQGNDINKMISFGGVGSFTKPQTTQSLLDELDYIIRMKQPGKTISDFTVESTDGYKAKTIDVTTESISAVDPSSYQAIISPAFARANGKKPITMTEFFKVIKRGGFKKLISDRNSLNKEYGKSVVYVDNIPYFIIGIGTTPDFAYPIIDQRNPTVNVDTQAVVFVNQRGYERTRESFSGNWKENYISFKFINNATPAIKQEILNNIEYIARNGNASLPKVSFPHNMELVTSASDESDQTMLVQERTMFLEKLKKSVGNLSYITTTTLIIFISAIVIMIFKVLISSNRKAFATMHALGYSKPKIAMSNAIAAFMLVAIPTIIAFPIGYLLQFLFTGVFDSQWTLPIFESSFSINSLMMIVIIPTLGAFALITLVTIWEMRYTIPQMLSNSTEKGSILTKFSHRIRGLGIKGKYAVSLSLKNIGKLILLGIATITSLSAIMVGLGSIGKANKAFNSTVAVSNYNFSIDLYSPTKEGGEYSELERTAIESPLSSSSKWHIPSAADLNFVDGNTVLNSSTLLDDINYLKGKYQTKALLDFTVAGINPWDIASSLMPENQLNIANEEAKSIKKYMKDNSLTNKDAVRDFVQNTNRRMPYTISYSDLIIDRGDETYTYIDGTINNDEQYRIKGVDTNTSMIEIGSNLDKLINFTDPNYIPIVIDKYISEHLRLSVGSSFDLSFTNHINRNKHDFDPNKDAVAKAKVVGIIDAYNKETIFTLKSEANKLIGLSPTGFNGVFSKEQNPTLLNTLPLYSPSGLYPATPSYNSVGWKNVLQKALADPKLNSDLQEVFDSSLTDVEKYNKFISIYSETPFVASTNQVAWKQMDKFAFESISKLSSAIILVMETVSISLSILFIVIVASLLFKTNRKKIATLWTIGYRKGELVRMLSAIYIIPITIALLFAVPISIGVLQSLKLLIMNTGQILIPLALSWWMPIIAFMIISLVFIGSTAITIFTQKQHSALEAFKGD